MSVLKGSAILLDAGANTIGVSRSSSINVQRNLIEVTSKDSDWKSREYGRLSWNVSVDGVIALDDAGQTALHAAIQAGTSVALSMGKATTATNDRTYSGSGYATSFGESFEENSDAPFDCEIQGTGALTVTTA